MKKYITFALTTAFLGVAAIASAQGITPLSDLTIFQSNLTLGSSGLEVANLQRLLVSQGFDIPAIRLGVTPPGYFGMQTRLAVQSYQAANGIPATGFVGPLTRARLNGSPNIPPQANALMLLSPNGGENWALGSQQTISWQLPNDKALLPITLYLVKNVSGCFGAGTRPCLAVVDPEYMIAQNLVNVTSYQWLVGNYATSPGYVSPSTIGPGTYYMRICRGGNCDNSNGLFTISGGGTVGQSPVINGIDAPSTLSVGQTGTWTVRAIDPLNGQLSYSVDWGDTYVAPGYAGAPAAQSFLQTTSFTHAYAQAGTYTVRFTVKNVNGQSTQTTATVNVTTTSSTAGPLQIVRPNGGELLQKGQTYTIMWTSPYYFRPTTVDISLVRQYTCSPGMACPAIAYAPMPIAKNVGANQNSYNWSVGSILVECPSGYSCLPNPIPEGQYQIQICETGTSNCDTSDSYFTITTSISSNVPDINITSPNGGETWTIGSNQYVTVNVTGDSSRVGNMVGVSLVDSYNQQISLTEYSIPNTTGIHSIPVSIPYTVQPNSYRVLVNLYKTGFSCLAIGCPPPPREQQAYDYSNGYITVSSGMNYTQPFVPYQNPYEITCPQGYFCTPQI